MNQDHEKPFPAALFCLRNASLCGETKKRWVNRGFGEVDTPVFGGPRGEGEDLQLCKVGLNEFCCPSGRGLGSTCVHDATEGVVAPQQRCWAIRLRLFQLEAESAVLWAAQPLALVSCFATWVPLSRQQTREAHVAPFKLLSLWQMENKDLKMSLHERTAPALSLAVCRFDEGESNSSDICVLNPWKNRICQSVSLFCLEPQHHCLTTQQRTCHLSVLLLLKELRWPRVQGTHTHAHTHTHVHTHAHTPNQEKYSNRRLSSLPILSWSPTQSNIEA